jgi:hypothetical protein
MSERERRLDAIRKHSEILTEVSERYSRLKYIAEQDSTDTFILLAEAAGNLTVGNLKATGDLLDILWRVGWNNE